ncbi:TIGR03087 family PEP-CTERM/XrtA system glycosyltransferase [Roseiterribacter gracilis]|uniref:Glycosyl transferase n=1 Tax=Roseiterribacter gracilis TaxID=2812848 RepID=A0A8S8X8G6_9PROT|nr:glycosyl transferase [Rhodospirillales bacterium TMPK1]
MDELLFLVHRIPFPPNKGDKIRSWHMLEQLARTHRVRLGCLIDDPHDLRYLDSLQKVCAEVKAVQVSPLQQKIHALLRLRPGKPLSLGYFHHPELQRWVRATVRANNIQKAFVFSSAMAPYLDGLALKRRVLDMVDVDSLKWRELGETSRFPANLVWSREWRTLFAYEKKLAQSFDETIFVSEAEMRRFLEIAPELAARVTWMSNGVDWQRFDPTSSYEDPYPASTNRIVFTGAMDYAPNIDAVEWFVTRVMPILRTMPRFKFGEGPQFWIVGSNPTERVQGLAGSDVHVTGRVADTRPWIQYAGVVVAPLRIARGIQNKVLEGMAMGKIVVATPQAREGIEADHARELLLSESEEGFARLVCEVLDGQWAKLGPAARAAVVQRYDWSERLKGLRAVWQQAA